MPTSAKGERLSPVRRKLSQLRYSLRKKQGAQCGRARRISNLPTRRVSTHRIKKLEKTLHLLQKQLYHIFNAEGRGWRLNEGEPVPTFVSSPVGSSFSEIEHN